MTETPPPPRGQGPRWGVLLLIALVVGGGYLYWREQEAQRCRRALMYSSPIRESYGGDADAALALAVEMNSQTARECYERGLISAPP